MATPLPAAQRPHLGWGDRVCLRWAAWTFAGLAAVVFVSTVGAVVTWWGVAEREGITGGGRTWPAVATAVLGVTAAIALYGISRVCRVVTRLCAATTHTAVSGRASADTIGRARLGPARNNDSVGGSRGALAGQA